MNGITWQEVAGVRSGRRGKIDGDFPDLVQFGLAQADEGVLGLDVGLPRVESQSRIQFLQPLALGSLQPADHANRGADRSAFFDFDKVRLCVR